MEKSEHKGHTLIRNEKFPRELCVALIDRWENATAAEPLKSRLASVTKRLFIDDLVIVEGGERYRAKFYRTIGLKRRLAAFFSRAESVKSLRAGIRLVEHGVPTAEPACVYGSWRGGLHDWSVLFMRDVGEHTMLPQFMDAFDLADHDAKMKVAIPLAKAIAKLHDAWVFVYDPSKNILVVRGDDGPRFVFIDFDTVAMFYPPTATQAARTLRHCIRPPGNLLMFDESERRAFAEAYLKERGLENWLDRVVKLL